MHDLELSADLILPLSSCYSKISWFLLEVNTPDSSLMITGKILYCREFPFE